ncbi:D-alanyl-D-alanine carboxypeptidase [Aquicoccus sp. SCR17]|nr:D-alanyl-D-alanine carboxypeptidase [Carideicomes alvinocaridis]
MLPSPRRFLAAALAFLLFALPAHAFDTRAEAAYVLDMTTGTVLLSKNADQPIPPASMSKLMTLYVAFEAIRDGRLTMDTRLPVSEHAMSYGGSTMFLDTTDRVRVEDLLQGIIVLSGNDACAVIAEALSPDGTEAGFARYMTQRAERLGLKHSHFENSNGWPAEGHVMSAHDLALLAKHIIQDFPQFYEMFSETHYEFDGRAPQNSSNRNPLLGLGIGADGLKTGHTQEAGYGLVGSAKQGDRRIVFVISGLESARARAEESEQIIHWAFRQFSQSTVAKAGQVVAEADVWMGDAGKVGLMPAKDLTLLLPAVGGKEVAAEVVYSTPLEAPLDQGQEVGQMIVRPEGLPEITVPLVTDRAVGHAGFLERMQTVATVLLRRLNEGPGDAT